MPDTSWARHAYDTPPSRSRVVGPQQGRWRTYIEKLTVTNAPLQTAHSRLLRENELVVAFRRRELADGTFSNPMHDWRKEVSKYVVDFEREAIRLQSTAVNSSLKILQHALENAGEPLGCSPVD